MESYLDQRLDADRLILQVESLPTLEQIRADREDQIICWLWSDNIR